jgi:hypothetical protein
MGAEEEGTEFPGRDFLDTMNWKGNQQLPFSSFL